MTARNIVIALIVIVIVLIAVFVYYPQRKVEKPPISPMPPEELETVPSPATGNVDDLADALTRELSDIESVFTGEEDDATLITTDSEEVSDFGQVINENEL